MMAYCIYPIRIGLLIPVFVRIQVLMIYPVFPISFLRIYLYHFLNLFNKCISSPDNVYRCIRAAPYVRIVCLIPNFNQNRRSSTFTCNSHYFFFTHIHNTAFLYITVYRMYIRLIFDFRELKIHFKQRIFTSIDPDFGLGLLCTFRPVYQRITDV